MRFLRVAEDSDRQDLEAFECARPGFAFEAEVEEGIRGILAWRDADAAHREVLVLDDDGILVAVVAHEDDEGDRFVNVVAVRMDHRGAGLGTELLASVLRELGSGFPQRIATWLVHPANFASHAMSARVGAEAIWPAGDKPYSRYVIRLVDPD